MKELKGKLRSDPALHTVEYMEEKFEKKIQVMGQEIKTSIIQELKSILPPTEKATYANITSSSRKDTIKSIIKEARNEEVAENKDKERRAANIIIHGVPESTSTAKDDEDTKFVKQLVKDLRVSVPTKNIVKVSRIGKPDIEKSDLLRLS